MYGNDLLQTTILFLMVSNFVARLGALNIHHLIISIDHLLRNINLKLSIYIYIYILYTEIYNTLYIIIIYMKRWVLNGAR